MIITGKLRQRLKVVRDTALRGAYRFGSHRVHYRLISRAFDRELAAVFSGIRKHHRNEDAGVEVFELRRRIHMVEKGLSMQPRRETFAAGYIVELLENVQRALKNGALDDETIAWARDVLKEYFEATSRSDHPSVIAAKATFADIDLVSSLPYCGPSTPVPPPIEFDPAAIESLAHHRRSVRWYIDRPVDREIVDRAVRVAVESPTACNRVPYQFRIFDRPGDARKVASIAGGTVGYVDNLQAVAVIVGDLSAYRDERDRHLIYIDGSLAAMGFIYSLEASGVSSCCINWPDLKVPEKEMSTLLGLAPHERVVMLVAYGYADPGGLAPASPKFSVERTRRFESLESNV